MRRIAVVGPGGAGKTTFSRQLGQLLGRRYPKDSRPRLDAAIDRHRDHLRVVELRSRRQADAFLRGLSVPRAGVGA